MSPASGADNAGEPSRKSARSRVSVNQCVPAIRAVEVPACVCLRNNCSHVTEVGVS